MAKLRKMQRREVEVAVSYGIGASCRGRFPAEATEGLTVRDLIGRVLRAPQQPGPSARTAAVLAGALEAQRKIDVELVRAARGGEREGVPVLLDDEALPAASDTSEGSSVEEVEQVSVLISEPYRGGSRCDAASSC